MNAADAKSVSIAVAPDQRVAGLLLVPEKPRAGFVLAHGAGAGMTHPFLAAMAAGLAKRRIATLRYQFVYMERGSKRPDPPTLAHAAVRAATAEAARRLPKLPLFAGGKSFGGRMTTQAQAVSALAGVRGLILVGFPLHPAGKPSLERAAHLADVGMPLLFLQGTRDPLAELTLLERLCRELGACATLELFPEADHSFHVPARSGRNDAEVREAMLDGMVAWMEKVTAR